MVGDTAIEELLTPLDHTKVPLQPEAKRLTLPPAHTNALSEVITGVVAAGVTDIVTGADVWLPQPIDAQVTE